MLTRNPIDAENPAIRHVNRFEAWSEQRAGENMPSYRGQIGEEELLEIIEYVKSLGNATQEVVP
jgi:mono/diheme cytochrome c family protein